MRASQLFADTKANQVIEQQARLATKRVSARLEAFSEWMSPTESARASSLIKRMAQTCRDSLGEAFAKQLRDHFACRATALNMPRHALR
ncbi:hypothetical protein C5688_15755 [Methylocystis sp. MitZ-2018]|nr:hypothetical protein C5688_15755 [Methylocystis sp. MitZ-2018]